MAIKFAISSTRINQSGFGENTRIRPERYDSYEKAESKIEIMLELSTTDIFIYKVEKIFIK